jgi:hypothetical protein
VAIEPHETLICGGLKLVEGHIVPDESLLRIRTLVETELERIGCTSDGWETLFRRRSDGRLWELFYPHGKLHGGGPESLRSISTVEAAHKYRFKVAVPTPPSPPMIDFTGMTTNECLYFAGLMSEWDTAAHSRNRERIVEILCKVGLGSQADQIAETVLANPKR